MIIPPFLKPGDTIGIAATARKVNEQEISAAIQAIENAGFRSKLTSNIYKAYHQFSGTDEERAQGFNELIKSDAVKAIWMARGGYGSVRLIDKINWTDLRNNPKWVCGFSDVTALHAHLQQKIGLASVHSEMMLGYEKSTAKAHKSMIDVLSGKSISYTFNQHALNKSGSINGTIVGGNLSVLYSLLGSESQLDTSGKILFLEDLDEYLYHVDRMMMAMKRAGMLAHLKALVVGGMSDMNDNAVPFGKSAVEIISETIAEYNYPVCFDFPAGHIADNRALILGREAKLNIGNIVTFTQEF